MQPIFARGNSRTPNRLVRLRQEAQTDKQPRVILRIQAILDSLDHQTPPQIASRLRVHRTRVHDWIRRWNDHGEAALLEGHRSGRPAGLNGEQRQRLADIIDSGPVAYGLQTGVWTSVLIREVIAEEFDLDYHPGHVRKLLHTCQLSVQRPTLQLAQANPKKQRRWVRYAFPDLKKKPVKRGR